MEPTLPTPEAPADHRPEPVAIRHGLYGSIEAAGPADALALLAPLQFRAPTAEGDPARRSVPEGPLDRQAAAAEAATRLRDGQWSVDLDPALQGSARSTAVLTALTDVSIALAEVENLVGEMEDAGELADLLGQLTIGPGNAMNGLEQILRACADRVRATTAPGHHDLVDRIRAEAARTSLAADNLAQWSSGLDAVRRSTRANAATTGSPGRQPAGAAPSAATALPRPSHPPRSR
ncbi:hypothetical protein [Kitasatospora sp. NRRL B-11411]|uniref:hypothetical protein n=1 Tax=Kitasatospora sp. NRRL B-11411 TaxID=1463822 RepID=UPI0004C3B655|nr:hypothetical protein [Kitasatospora sp. NRRL B-11411]